MSFRSTAKILQATMKEFLEDKALTLGAAVAYYAISSTGPLLVILLGVAGLVFGTTEAQAQLTQQLRGVLGDQAAGVAQSMMASQTNRGSFLATVIGSVALLLAASGVFGQLKSSLNTIWKVKSKPGRRAVGLVLDRLTSLIMVLGIGVLLVLSLMLTAALSIFSKQIERFIALPSVTVLALNLVVSWLLMSLLFTLIFKVLPDVRVPWRAVWRGALFTGALFILGEYLLSWYLGRKGTSSSYGAAGAVVLLLMWIYYSALLLFAGAEFTKVYATHHGSRVEPGKYAVPLEEPYFGLLQREPA